MPLPVPRGRQTDVLYYEDHGNLVVLGTAGSGKTTLAILRAVYLSRDCLHAGRTLLVTFNRTLANYLDYLDPEAAHDVDICSYHSFATGYLHNRGALPPGSSILPDNRIPDLVADAMQALRAEHPQSTLLNMPVNAVVGEITWISKMGILTADQYQGVQRVKRGGFRITRKDRAVMWEIRELYVRARGEAGRTFDFHDIATAVRVALEEDDTARRYKHIVIDEGQDFSPEMLRSLSAAIPGDGSITLFGDVAQQIYGGRISWRDAGFDLAGRPIIRFEENYRNTRQIADFAIAFSNGPHFRGGADMVAPREVQAAGVLPSVVSFQDFDDELGFVVDQAAALAKNRSVGILLRAKTALNGIKSMLARKGIEAVVLNRQSTDFATGPGVWISNYYNAKGLEFNAVLMPRLGTDHTPPRYRQDAHQDDTLWMAEEARLLYVGFTRAKAELIITYTNELTPLLQGIDEKLYQAVTR